MRLNLHIIAHSLGEIVRESRIPEDSALTVLNARCPDIKEESFPTDVVYILSESGPCFERLNDGKHQLIVIPADDARNTLMKVRGPCLILGPEQSAGAVAPMMNAVFERYNRWEQMVESAIAHGASTESVLALGFSSMGNPMALCDASLHCLATCHEEMIPEDNSVWKSISEPGHTNVSLNMLLRRENLLEKVRNEPRSFVYRLQGDKEEILHTNIFSADKRIAYLVTFAAFQPINMCICSIANRLGELLAFSLSTHSLVRYDKPLNVDVLSQRILSGETTDKVYIKYVLEQNGWNEEDHYCVCEFEMLENMTSGGLLTDIALFQAAIHDSSVLHYRAGIVVVHNLTKSKWDLDGLVTAVEGLLRQRSYAGGISEEFSGYSDLRMYECEAYYAMNCSKRRAQSGQKQFFTYRECMVETLLSVCADQMDLRLLCRSDIQELWEYDKEKKAPTSIRYIRTSPPEKTWWKAQSCCTSTGILWCTGLVKSWIFWAPMPLPQKTACWKCSYPARS